MSGNGDQNLFIGGTVRIKEHPSLGIGMITCRNHDGTFRVQCERSLLRSVFPESLISSDAPPPPLPLKMELDRYGARRLWHISDIGNLESICKLGILSHTSAYREVSGIVDISDADVQKHRALCEPIYGRPIHEYAPLYFVPRNPMLYRRRDMRDSIAILEVMTDFLTTENCLFTDGNAASLDTDFYRDIENVKGLPWDVIHAKSWNEFVDGRRKRCAEVLVYPRVPVSWITCIHCPTSELVERLKYLPVPVFKNRGLFFSRY